jgi:methenyltetrahydromethanopterin cyclohydrolase
MAADAEKLGITVSKLECGTRIIDCGVKAAGSLEAGLALACVCMAGLGTASVETGEIKGPGGSSWQGELVNVTVHDPVAACMASQYAGWQLMGEKFFAMGSGPMRAAACREELFHDIGHCEHPEICVGVLETSKLPPDAVCEDIAKKCQIRSERLTLLAARTSSIAGTVQIVARSVETALHKLHALGFDLTKIVEGYGSAPLPPSCDDDMVALGRTNDAILYGGAVMLRIQGEGLNFDTLDEVLVRVPSSASADYGRPFGEIFAHYGGDFYKIDPMLFSPAIIRAENLHSGLKHYYGQYAPDVLADSFGAKK